MSNSKLNNLILFDTQRTPINNLGKSLCWPIACQRGDSTTTRRTWSTIHQRSLDGAILPSTSPGDASASRLAQQKRLDDFEDLDSMYSAYDNWHRGMIISRSASATFPRGSVSHNGSERMQERGEGNSLDATDEKMFLQISSSSVPKAYGRASGGAGAAVPFYKTLLSNLSKNNQTYTVNEE